MQLRNRLKFLAGIAFGLALSTLAAAQSYPTRTIRLIVPFPPGGAGDLVMRPLAQKLTESMGQPVVLENRPGADTIIGMDTIAKAAPDGYTIGLAINAGLTMNGALYSKLPYDPAKDFAPITMLNTVPLVVVVGASAPVKSMAELAALIKANPGKYNYGSGNTVSRLASERLSSMIGGKIVGVSYKGTAPTLTDLMRGDVLFSFEPVGAVLPRVTAGKRRALGVAEPKRLAAVPEWPTIAESGFPGFEMPVWYSILAPAGTPADIVSRLHNEIVKAMRQPDLTARLTTIGFEPILTGGDTVIARANAERAVWSKLIAEWNIKLD